MLSQTDTPRPPLEYALRAAFAGEDPLQRRESVIEATELFLRDASIQQSDDEIASAYFNQVAFSSGKLTLTEPAVIQRRQALAVVALPDGMGLYLYNLDEPAGSPPLEITRWLVGLHTIQVVWGDDIIGIGYRTTGSDSVTRVSFVLLSAQNARWDVAWHTDYQPEWWFNAYNATLEIAPDLSTVVVVGEAYNTTEATYELTGSPLRTFRITWSREDAEMRMSPPESAYPTRQQWLWSTAEPSAYATFVEYLERLQGNDADGASGLVRTGSVTRTAREFGLHFPGRRYQVLSYDETHITFRDLQAAFIMSLSPPTSDRPQWQITDIRPLGASGGGD